MAFTIVQSVTNKAGEAEIIPSVTAESGVVVPSVSAITGEVNLIPSTTDKQVPAIAVGTPMGLLLAITYAT